MDDRCALEFNQRNMDEAGVCINNYQTDIKKHRMLMSSADILGDNAMYMVDGNGTLYLQMLTRKEVEEYHDHMKEVEKCYQ